MSADHQTLIAEALAAHEVVWENDGGDYGGRSWIECSCDADNPLTPTEYATEAEHAAHRAAALLDSPEFAAVLADVRAGALREAAEVMPFGYSHAAAILREQARADERTSDE